MLRHVTELNHRANFLTDTRTASAALHPQELATMGFIHLVGGTFSENTFVCVDFCLCKLLLNNLLSV